MEDKINVIRKDNNSPDLFNYESKLPIIIDQDDVTFELGKLQIDILNKQKLLTNLIRKVKELEKSILENEKELLSIQEALKESDNSILENKKELKKEKDKFKKLEAKYIK